VARKHLLPVLVARNARKHLLPVLVARKHLWPLLVARKHLLLLMVARNARKHLLLLLVASKHLLPLHNAPHYTMSPTTPPPPQNSNILCARRHSPGFRILVRARKQRDNQYVERNRTRCSSLSTCVGEMPRKDCIADVAYHRSILIHVYRLFLYLRAETHDAKNLLCMKGQISEKKEILYKNETRRNDARLYYRHLSQRNI
jgi:hypothetical protein